jgi:WD repeat-containing protein 23
MARYLASELSWLMMKEAGSTRYEVYDLLANRRTVKIDAHQDDVNSCCWADTASGNVLISASDDTFLKVWWVSTLASLMAGPTQ